MYAQDHVLHCDKPFCGERFDGGRGRTTLNLKLARQHGWHVSPCDCPWKDFIGYRWKHQRDYCPAHYLKKPKPIVNLPPLLPGFTLH
jgi:hypothetical protein